ncbi:unnamed protein product [Ilex paraguariensis]|uniref:Uncharacterized protein n=1 Tax=Ilex paraguariensis TaxID=185542 RepID=A0ABC8RYE9_9AQUA
MVYEAGKIKYFHHKHPDYMSLLVLDEMAKQQVFIVFNTLYPNTIANIYIEHRTIKDVIDGQDFTKYYVEMRHSVVIEEINEDDVDVLDYSQVTEVLKIDCCNRKNLLEYSEVNASGDVGGEE